MMIKGMMMTTTTTMMMTSNNEVDLNTNMEFDDDDGNDYDDGVTTIIKFNKTKGLIHKVINKSNPSSKFHLINT